MARNVLTLSRLYPSTAYPGWGPFVRDEVVELARRNRMVVVSPLLWHSRWFSSLGRKVAAVPRVAVEDGIKVVRPRLPGARIGGRIVDPALWTLRLHPLMKRLYREVEGDLVHAHFALPDGFAAAQFASREDVPFVLTIWGSDVLVLGNQWISRTLLKRTIDRARAVIAVSDELAEKALGLGARDERVRVITGGVPYLPLEPREAARELLGVDAESICVLWVGGLVPVKQPLHMLEAFAEFALSRRSEASLVMIGDGPLRKDVSRFVRERRLGGMVRVLGHLGRADVWRWQCAADVLVNSSRSEGTPLSVLEAVGAGTPVAAYPLPGVRAVLSAVGGGELAVDRTPRALAEAIGIALGSERDRVALASDAREQFNISRVAREIESVYETVS